MPSFSLFLLFVSIFIFSIIREKIVNRKKPHFFDRHYNYKTNADTKYKLLITGLNDAIDAIVGFFLAPCINGIRSLRALTKVYRLDVRTIVRLEILFILRFHWEIFADKHLVSELQSNIFNILQKEYS